MKLASILMRTKHLKWSSHLLLGIKRMAIHIFVHSRPTQGLPEQSDGIPWGFIYKINLNKDHRPKGGNPWVAKRRQS